MTKDEALKMALEALKQIDEAMPFPVAKLAQKAIREALAQPEQEPVVWMYQDKTSHAVKFQRHMSNFVDHSKTSEIPLYSEPLANHELQCVCGAVWCGDEMVHLPNKIPPQPEQEPVAWANLNALSEQINSVNCGTVYRLPSEAEKRQPLYTTPPPRKPWAGLTEQEHTDIAVECGCMSSDWVFYGATVERLLKEKNS